MGKNKVVKDRQGFALDRIQNGYHFQKGRRGGGVQDSLLILVFQWLESCARRGGRNKTTPRGNWGRGCGGSTEYQAVSELQHVAENKECPAINKPVHQGSWQILAHSKLPYRHAGKQRTTREIEDNQGNRGQPGKQRTTKEIEDNQGNREQPGKQRTNKENRKTHRYKTIPSIFLGFIVFMTT